MKITLTLEQSQKLVELGVDPKLANVCVDVLDCDKPDWNDPNAIDKLESQCAFSLESLLAILPKEIEYSGITYGLNIWVESAVWYVEYCAEKGVYDFLIDSNIDAPELIDALYSLLVWLKTERAVEI